MPLIAESVEEPAGLWVEPEAEGGLGGHGKHIPHEQRVKQMKQPGETQSDRRFHWVEPGFQRAAPELAIKDPAAVYWDELGSQGPHGHRRGVLPHGPGRDQHHPRRGRGAAALRLHPAHRHRRHRPCGPARDRPELGRPPHLGAPHRGVDKRKNSRQCRDDVVGIPVELVEAGVAEEAIQAYADRLAREHKTVVHFALHRPDRGGKNHHGTRPLSGAACGRPDVRSDAGPQAGGRAAAAGRSGWLAASEVGRSIQRLPRSGLVQFDL